MVATYAIGDIQGCYQALMQLLERIQFNKTRDRLWLVGDLVNRGPQSLEVLRFVRDLGDRAVTVLGNHDLHLVMQSEGYGRANSEDTLAPILAAPDRGELMAWLRSCPLVHREDNHLMVHAGLLPGWTADQALALSEEVRTALLRPDYRDFLANMWGSLPVAWQDDLQGWDRLRVVVNATTRMRFCTLAGAMDFRSKGPPEHASEGSLPWFQLPHRAHADHTVVCGHWSALGLRLEHNLMALDSGCLWGGALTAVRLEDREVFQLPCERQVEPTGWD